MDKIIRLLKILQKETINTQRNISEETGFSLGMVNTLLKQMRDRELIASGTGDNKRKYYLTKKGNTFLENLIREKQKETLILKEDKTLKVEDAVILAAGISNQFDTPIALQEIEEGKCMIDRHIDMLKDLGIKNIHVIVGYKKEQFEEHFKNTDIHLIENSRYKWTGTMYSLALAKEYLTKDFIVVEGDHLIEKKILSELLKKQGSCFVLTHPSGGENDAFVEFDENGNIIKISKDMHQFLHIDACFSGIHRFTHELYEKLLEQLAESKNPYLNYEYAIERLARLYKFDTMYLDDTFCVNIYKEEQFLKTLNVVYPAILKREKEFDHQYVLDTFLDITEQNVEDVISLDYAGGLTNKNYRVKTKTNEYILRIPGKCTETMISRKNEKYNSKIGYLLNLNVDTIYFNEHSGVKLTKYVENAETLNPSTAKLEENMAMVTDLLRTLHTSEVELQSEFDVCKELVKYEKLTEDAHGTYYEGYDNVRKEFYEFIERLNVIGVDCIPCHNDLVAENLIKNKKRMYLIDWEYAGMNDPMWDLAAHLIECEFNEEEEELFLNYYFQGNEITKSSKQKILIYKILQDILWSVWTMAKEANGEDFGTYGPDRMHRAERLIKEYKTTYEN